MAKITIKQAVKGLNRFDLSSNHGCSTDFGQIQVSHFMPVVPNDKIHASLFSEARFAPLVVPTFMDCKLVTRSFYVPMSAIWKPFEYFYTDRQDASAYKSLPQCTNKDVCDYIVSTVPNVTGALVREIDPDIMKQDFEYKDGSNPTKHYVWTERGRVFKKLYESLGYRLNFTQSDTTPFTLLPFLAYMRVAYDYIYPSQYVDGLALTKYFNISSSSDYTACFGSASLRASFFESLINLLTLPYKQDYFTASWQNVNQPGTSVQSFSLTTGSTIGGQPEYVFSSADKIGQVAQTASSQSSLSQQGLNLLSRLYDFITRNNIVGVRYADQIFARFGIGSRRSDPDMSQFIGQHIQPINVVDVTSMASTEQADLGELGGKAYLQGSGKLFDFESADEFGYLLSLSFVMPDIGYYQGRRRWTTVFTRLDGFYTPEFDMQMRAVRNDELFADYTSPTDYTNGQSYGGNPSNRFSFVPNYSDLKTGYDTLTGDFTVPSLSENLKSYFLMRDIPKPELAAPLALNSAFLFQEQHQFDKIFAQQYTLRAPLSVNNYGVYNQSVVLYDGLPIVFRIQGDSNGAFVLITGKYNSNHSTEEVACRPHYYGSSELQGVFGIVLTNEQTYYNVPYTTDSTGHYYSVAGYGWYIYNRTDSDFVTNNYVVSDSDHFNLSWTGTPLLVYHLSEFLSRYQDYIDHIYLKHHFNILGVRNMETISSEFMIQDGGQSVSVDMNGNRIV